MAKLLTDHIHHYLKPILFILLVHFQTQLFLFEHINFKIIQTSSIILTDSINLLEDNFNMDLLGKIFSFHSGYTFQNLLITY